MEIDDDLTTDKEKMLKETEDRLYLFGGEFIEKGNIKMRICYLKKDLEKDNLQSTKEFYIFHHVDKESTDYILCKNKISNEEYQIYANEVDSNFNTMCEKMNIFNFRQAYNIEYTSIKIGDMTFKIGMIYRDIVMKQIFLEIHNPYSNKYDEIKDFSYGVIKNIFPNVNNLADMCLFDKTLESLYRKNLVNANNHHELIQYAYLVLKKHVNLK